MATEKVKRIPLRIGDPEQEIPKVLRATGDGCIGRMIYVAVPHKHVGAMVHKIGSVHKLWTSSEKKDSPTSPRREVTAAQAAEGLKQVSLMADSVQADKSPSAMKGSWKGYVECDQEEPPIVVLKRSVDRFVLLVGSAPGGWQFKVINGKTNEVEHEGSGIETLASALRQVWSKVTGSVSRACTTEMMTDKNRVDPERGKRAKERAERSAEARQLKREEDIKAGRRAPPKRPPGKRRTHAERVAETATRINKRIQQLEKRAKAEAARIARAEKKAERDARRAEGGGRRRVTLTEEEKAARKAAREANKTSGGRKKGKGGGGRKKSGGGGKKGGGGRKGGTGTTVATVTAPAEGAVTSSASRRGRKARGEGEARAAKAPRAPRAPKAPRAQAEALSHGSSSGDPSVAARVEAAAEAGMQNAALTIRELFGSK